MSTNNRYVVCYPGGSGGSFVAAALDAAVFNKEFRVDSTLGHCHNNEHKRYHRWFDHGQNISSFRQELDAIESMIFSDVIEGHYRNIVAIKEKIIENVGYNNSADTMFVKVVVDCQNPKEILFVASMLKRKTNFFPKGCFPELSHDEYLLQTTNYIKSWYWIENAYTLPNTITLTLSDIFLNKISGKLGLSTQTAIKLDQYQNEYLNIQNQLHQDLIQLLHEQ